MTMCFSVPMKHIPLVDIRVIGNPGDRETLGYQRGLINPSRTAAPFWGQIALNLTGMPPKRAASSFRSMSAIKRRGYPGIEGKTDSIHGNIVVSISRNFSFETASSTSFNKSTTGTYNTFLLKGRNLYNYTRRHEVLRTFAFVIVYQVYAQHYTTAAVGEHVEQGSASARAVSSARTAAVVSIRISTGPQPLRAADTLREEAYARSRGRR